MSNRFPHAGEVLGASPAHPLLVPALSVAPGLSMSRQQALLDLQAIQRIPGLAGYWPADPAYLYEDSAGTIPATVGGVVGCVRNVVAAPVYTPVTIANADFAADSDWTKGTGWTIADGVATKAAGTGSALSQAVSLTPGNTYLVTWTQSQTGGTTLTPTFSGGTTVNGSAFTTSGTWSAVLVALTGNTTLNFSAATSFAGTIDNVTLVSVSNSPALQSTTANKPYLRRTPTSGVHWLDSNTSTSALNVALSDTALGRRNLLTYTEDFSNAAWTKTRVTATANAALAPDGTTTAIEIAATATDTSLYVYVQPTLGTAGLTYTNSVWLKKKVIKYVQVMIPTAIVSGGYVNFGLETGVISATGGSGVTASISDAGNGWYRCTVTIASVGAGAAGFLTLYAVDGPTDIRGASYTGGAIGDSYYLWHPQVELGATATDYQKITSVSAPAYCTVARATAEGVTFAENAEITASYNIAPAYGFNGDIAIFNRALTTTEKALLTRYMQRGVPVLGSERVTNGTFDTDLTGWTTTGTDAGKSVTWSDGGARYVVDAVSPTLLLNQSGVFVVNNYYYGSLSAKNIVAFGVNDNNASDLQLAASVPSLKFVKKATATQFSLTRLAAPTDITIDSVSWKEIL